MSWLLLDDWARLLLVLVLLIVPPSQPVHFADAASRNGNRHSIKINPGPAVATRTPTFSSHTFSMPDIDPVPTTTANRPSSQANAIRASKLPGTLQSHLPPRSPTNFTLPPPLLNEWHSQSDAAGGGEVDVRFDEMYEEALWRRWDGDCMALRQDSYLYSLCPFHNITQRGLLLTSLNVVLGVWSSWWVTPDHQLAMNYTDGTRCNQQLHRSTTLVLHCSAPSSITHSTVPLPPIDTLADYSPSYISAVDEPVTCVYVVHWYTPLVCSTYRKVADELSWRQQQRSSQPTLQSTHQRSRTKWREQLERELEEDEEGGGGVQGGEGQQVSLLGMGSGVVRGYLDCIAAMSAPHAAAESYRSLCAAYLQSSQAVQPSTARDDGVA